GCPHCDLPDCIVLATIKDWHVDDKIIDLPAGPLPAGSAAIDNLLGRIFLASTQLITEVINCILENPGGGPRATGPTGHTGPTGPTGPTAPVPPPPGPFTRIQSVNWRHRRRNPLSTFRESGLQIAFDTQSVNHGDVINTGGQLEQRVFIVLRRTEHRDAATGQVVDCWCEVRGRIRSGNFATLGDATSLFTPATGTVNGVQFLPDD